MRYVYEVLIDFDDTTRSRFESAGLFATKELAEDCVKSFNLTNTYGCAVIKIREVKGS